MFIPWPAAHLDAIIFATRMPTVYGTEYLMRLISANSTVQRLAMANRAYAALSMEAALTSMRIPGPMVLVSVTRFR